MCSVVRRALNTTVKRFFPVALVLLSGADAAGIAPEQPGYLQPPVWPEHFHSKQLQNDSSRLALVDLWYDWSNGRNLNVIHRQLGSSLWDLEWTNGTSYFFDREADTCRLLSFPVGILPPDWLKGAHYLGKDIASNHSCHVWQKGYSHFITYWADVQTNLPVRWIFGLNGVVFDILTWEEQAVLAEEHWQAPSSCFNAKLQHLAGSRQDMLARSSAHLIT